MRPLAIAHRGASGRELENSLAAFRAAGRLGADAVELDVHATADGAFVVHHDDAIGHRPISELTQAEVLAHTLSNGERVPTLEASLGVILPGLTAFVEIKTVDERWDTRLLATFDATDAPPERLAVHSFDHRIVHRLGILRPALARGILSSARVVQPVQALQDAGADTLWQRWNHVDARVVSEVHAAGGRVIAWTADEPAEIERLLRIGVDGVCSNHPDRVRAAVDSHRE